jgi:hypothetical protein
LLEKVDHGEGGGRSARLDLAERSGTAFGVETMKGVGGNLVDGGDAVAGREQSSCAAEVLS